MESETPARRRIVVDGSNLATEGRTLPSLAQLSEAIDTFLEEHPGFKAEDVTVVVDASFGHRIDPSEVKDFEQAIEHGEMVTPPAGAVGRGDGFILRIAEKSGALVLSNDSFQEFHAERPWLFEPGRLIGGKPVPGVGWVFTPRTPVRGPRSRSVTAQSKREAKAAIAATDGDVETESPDEVVERPKPSRRRRSAKAAAANGPAPVTSDTADAHDAYEALDGRAARTTKATKKAAKVAAATTATKPAKATKTTKKAAKALPTGDADAPAKATKATKAEKAAKATKATKTAKTTKAAKKAGAAVVTDDAADGRRRRDVPVGEALNDTMTFITFVADHAVGSTFEGEVVSFTSHGAHVDVGGMLCHIPLRNLGDPPPQKARSVLTKGESRMFELVALDAPRRRAELTLP